MSNSSGKIPQTQILASFDQQPPFYSIQDRSPAKKQQDIYGQYHTLSDLGGVEVPSKLHWAVQVISATEVKNNEPGYIWELAQKSGKATINVS